ncbi:MAG: hypothetical protein NTW25_07020 [Candidatus Kapabacteria bacterium]|nr:hypothetical protein [Candidatus Kapabacteria bacterium]
MKLLLYFSLIYLIISSFELKSATYNLQDTSNVEIVVSDSLDETDLADDAELDSLEAELEKVDEKWNAYAALKYSNKKIDRGIDESAGKGSLMQSFSIGHKSGFTLGLDVRQSLGNPILFNDQNIFLDYVFSISDKIDLGATIGKQKYATDTASAMSGTNNSFSLYTDIKISSFYLDLSFDRYSGNSESFNYFSSTLFRSFYLNSSESLKLSPMLSLTFSSYTVDSLRIVKKIAKKPVKPLKYQVTNFGLGSALISLKLAYKITPTIGISFTPALNYIPKRDNDSSSLDFLSYFSVYYDLDF